MSQGNDKIEGHGGLSDTGRWVWRQESEDLRDTPRNEVESTSPMGGWDLRDTLRNEVESTSPMGGWSLIGQWGVLID